jgi:hypothetical protein
LRRRTTDPEEAEERELSWARASSLALQRAPAAHEQDSRLKFWRSLRMTEGRERERRSEPSGRNSRTFQGERLGQAPSLRTTIL